jgi:hypothetical protein
MKHAISPGTAIVLVFTAACGFSAGCGPRIDIARALQVDGISTGWYHAGVVEGGKTKIVPAVSFRLKNVSDEKLDTLQVNAVFRRAGDDDEWGSNFVADAASNGLTPGAATDTLTLKSQLGYTGTESRADMLKNSHFVDAKVDLYAKYASTKWTRLGEFPITRQLIEP